jgi:hypothetical protein
MAAEREYAGLSPNSEMQASNNSFDLKTLAEATENLKDCFGSYKAMKKSATQLERPDVIRSKKALRVSPLGCTVMKYQPSPRILTRAKATEHPCFEKSFSSHLALSGEPNCPLATAKTHTLTSTEMLNLPEFPPLKDVRGDGKARNARKGLQKSNEKRPEKANANKTDTSRRKGKGGSKTPQSSAPTRSPKSNDLFSKLIVEIANKARSTNPWRATCVSPGCPGLWNYGDALSPGRRCRQPRGTSPNRPAKPQYSQKLQNDSAQVSPLSDVLVAPSACKALPSHYLKAIHRVVEEEPPCPKPRPPQHQRIAWERKVPTARSPSAGEQDAGIRPPQPQNRGRKRMHIRLQR